MRKYLFLSLLFFSTVVRGETEQKRKVQLIKKAVSETEVKTHLIHQGVWEAILERSSELQFDSNLLTKLVHERFDSHWMKLKKRRARERFGKTFELTEEANKQFFESLESQREDEFVKYLRLSALLEDSNLKFQEQGADGLWTSEVSFRFNKSKLDRFLNRFLFNQAWTYENLLIIAEIDLVGLGWRDLGLEKAEDFISPLRSSWTDLAQEVASTQIKEIEDCKDICLNDFQDWLKASVGNLSTDANSSFRRNLLLKISFILKKKGARPHLGEIDLEWEGKFILLDGESKKTLFSMSIPHARKTFQQLDQKSLNSAIAGHMYRSSKDLIVGIERVITGSKRFSQITLLSLTGHSNLGDVVVFIQKLRKEGEPLSLDLQIDLFTQKEARLTALYKGEEKSFTDLLSKLKELKSSHSYKIISEPSENGFSLKFMAE